MPHYGRLLIYRFRSVPRIAPPDWAIREITSVTQLVGGAIENPLAEGPARTYALTLVMGLNDLIHGLWIVGLAMQPVLAGILVFKRHWIKFPFFTTYVAFSLIGDFAGYLLLRYGHSYLYVYLTYETVAVILALTVIYEVFTEIFASHLALRKTAKVAFQVAGGLLILLGAVVLYTHGPIAQKGLTTAVLVVEEASRILEVGLIMFLFIFSTAFGLHWRQSIFGIAVGLGIAAAVKLAAVTILPQSYVVAGVVNVAVMVASDLSLLIWIAYLLSPERVTQNDELPKTAQLERWNQAIMELIHQ
jgi:hypothetical protein